MTTSGAAWERALKHLDELGLPAMARTDGWLELARNSRALLCQAFETHLIEYVRTTLSEGVSEQALL
jgi:hypothetical protein